MNNRILSKAIELASQLTHKKQRLCAIVTDKRDRILNIGFNFYNKTSTTQAYYAEKVGLSNKIYIHAEIGALTNLHGKPHTIYIARVSKNGQSLPSKPCPICQMAIRDAGIKEIITT
jgi:tRNA(Arg) A34 adenosine deaminase TadA